MTGSGRQPASSERALRLSRPSGPTGLPGACVGPSPRSLPTPPFPPRQVRPFPQLDLYRPATPGDSLGYSSRRASAAVHQIRESIAFVVTNSWMGERTMTNAAGAEGTKGARRVTGQVLHCGWCGGEVTVRSRGRTPKWCSPSCRQRAWEQKRAAESGRAAVEVVDREVVSTRTVEVEKRVEVEVPVQPRTVDELVHVLNLLAGRIDMGSVYDRDLPAVVQAVDGVVRALNRRQKVSRRALW